MFKELFIIIIIGCLIAGCIESEKADRKSIKEETEWSHTWMVHTSKNDLPRVLIIGDSHVENYYSIIAIELQGAAYCCKLTTSKSLGDPILIDQIEIILKQYNFDIITFNNGLHGKEYTEKQYGGYIPILYDLFLKHSNAKIIWINTTALRNKDNIDEFDDFNARIIKRNQLVEDFLKSRNIPVIDLYSLSVDNTGFYKNDGCHFNSEGVVEEGILVAEQIRKMLNIP